MGVAAHEPGAPPASLRSTGTGKVFAAFRERAEIEAALAEEGAAGALDEPGFAAELADIRREHIARVRDDLLATMACHGAAIRHAAH